jgi:WD40 repeat protein
MDFSADGRRLAIGGMGGMLQVRSVPDGRLLWEKQIPGVVDAVEFHPSERLLATAGQDRIIRIWEAETGRLHRRLEGHTGRIWALRFHPGGTRLVSGSHDATVRIWDPETGLEKLRLTGHENYVYDLAFSPDGTALATGSGDTSVRIWSTRPMRERWKESGE